MSSKSMISFLDDPAVRPDILPALRREAFSSILRKLIMSVSVPRCAQQNRAANYNMLAALD